MCMCMCVCVLLQDLDCCVPLLKVDEGVVLQLLHSLQFSKLTEGFLQKFFCDAIGQIPDK